MYPPTMPWQAEALPTIQAVALRDRQLLSAAVHALAEIGPVGIELQWAAGQREGKATRLLKLREH